MDLFQARSILWNDPAQVVLWSKNVVKFLNLLFEWCITDNMRTMVNRAHAYKLLRSLTNNHYPLAICEYRPGNKGTVLCHLHPHQYQVPVVASGLRRAQQIQGPQRCRIPRWQHRNSDLRHWYPGLNNAHSRFRRPQTVLVLLAVPLPGRHLTGTKLPHSSPIASYHLHTDDLVQTQYHRHTSQGPGPEDIECHSCQGVPMDLGDFVRAREDLSYLR